jgi:hypothetical protein
MVSTASDHADLQGAGERSSAPTGAEDPERLDAAARSWGEEVTAIWVALTRSLDLQRQAVGLRLFDAAWRSVMAAIAAVMAIIVAASATLLLIEGARRGLATWTGNAWLSDLVLGGVLAAALGSGLYSVQRMVHQTTLKRMQRKIAPTRAERVQA